MRVVGARPQIHRVGKKPALRARLHALRTAGCAELATMLRLPRAAHYSICESLCARDTAEEEAERSRRNKEMLPADKNLGHMTIEEKYDFARKYKDAGNVFFKEGR